MSISHTGITSAVGHQTSILHASLPFSISEHRLTAYFGAVFAPGTTPSVATPSGWTLIPDGLSINGQRVLLGVFTRAGGGDSTVGFILNRQAQKVFVYVVADDELDAAHLDDSNASTGTGTVSHAAPTITTTVDDTLVQAVYLVRRNGLTIPDFVLAKPTGMSELVRYDDIIVSDDTTSFSFLVAEVFQGENGATGNKTAISSFTGDGAYYLLALKPTQAPSRPAFISPQPEGSIGSFSIIEGITYQVALSPSTSPLIDQDDIQYEIDYSSTGKNGTFTNIITTAAGVTTANWNTTGLNPGNFYILRARAIDATNSKQSGYAYTIQFIIAEDVDPGVPSDLHMEQPEGTRVNPGDWLNNPAIDIAQDSWFKGTFNDPGDIMSSFDVDWGTDNVTFANTSTNPSSVYSKMYGGSTFSAGTKFFRSRTDDNASNTGPYGFLSVPMGSKPATPSITSPTTTITTANPLFTFTSGGHFGFRFRVEISGIEVHDSGIILSSGGSFTLSFDFQNSTSPTVFLSVYSSIGLRSSEASAAYSVAYTPPAQPTVLATAVADSGYVQVEGTNSDTPDEMVLYRYEVGFEATRTVEVANGLDPDPVFLDNNCPHNVQVKYYWQARDANELFIDSDDSDAIILILSDIWLHTVSRTGINSNVKPSPLGLPDVINLKAAGPFRPIRQHATRTFRVRGRGVLTTFGQTVHRQIEANCIVQRTEFNKLERLYEMFDDGGVICARGAGEKQIFGFLQDTRKDIQAGELFYRVPIRVIGTNYSEDLRVAYV